MRYIQESQEWERPGKNTLASLTLVVVHSRKDDGKRAPMKKKGRQARKQQLAENQQGININKCLFAM